MKVCAWVSDDGRAVEALEHEGHAGLLAWWRSLSGVVGVMVVFPDGTRHSMEASEYYAVMPHGRERARFWNGDNPDKAPFGGHILAGIEVPSDVYECASLEMGEWYG